MSNERSRQQSSLFFAKSVRQLAQKSRVIAMRLEEQGELSLSRPPASATVPQELVRAQRHSAAAFCLACQASGLDDKEIYLPLNIDSGTFSRIKKGEANFPLDKLHLFCVTVGNQIFADWIAYQVGCQLVMIQSEAERRAEQAERERDEAIREANMLKKLLVGRAA